MDNPQRGLDFHARTTRDGLDVGRASRFSTISTRNRYRSSFPGGILGYPVTRFVLQIFRIEIRLWGKKPTSHLHQLNFGISRRGGTGSLGAVAEKGRKNRVCCARTRGLFTVSLPRSAARRCTSDRTGELSLRFMVEPRSESVILVDFDSHFATWGVLLRRTVELSYRSL